MARAMSICWIGVGAIANTVSKPALHIEHEAIPPLGRSCGGATCASPLPAALPRSPDNAYLRDQFCPPVAISMEGSLVTYLIRSMRLV